MNFLQLTRSLLLLIVVMAFAPYAYGSGYAVFTQGASALGQGNAVTAHADDPSAVFYNPALMNSLPGTQVMLGTTLISADRNFSALPGGNDAETKDTINYPSTLYITHKFNEKISAGLGVFSPFGLAHEWGTEWDGRYITTNTKLQTFDINPAVSWQIIPGVALAVGVDVLFLDATLEKNIKLPSGFPDAASKFKGDGTGVGYNAGLLVDLGKDASFGVAYRSQIKVTAKGDATFSNVPPALKNTGGETDITLPQQITAGLAYKGIDRLVLEAGMRWEGWSSFDELKIDFDNGNKSSVSPRAWKDVYGFNVGATYRLNDTFSLLGGYLYGNTPVPDSTFDPTIPDADTHVFSIGTDVDYKKFKISLAYAYQLLENRNKDNKIGAPSPPANGKYETDAHLLALGLTYKF
jgi:long-chain fatty acid transport protein